MIVLGSTGSIGTNALRLAERFDIKVHALACGKNVNLLNEQIAKFKPRFVCVGEKALKSAVKFDGEVFCGEDGIKQLLRACASEFGTQNSQNAKECVVNALVGFSGLNPSIEAQSLGYKLCLANKESLVAGGKFLKTSEIAPIDSEHFGLKFLLKGRESEVKRLLITASGGAFLNLSASELAGVTPQMALKHPNWSMGAKITIDSASMANKLFEVLEAFWLYGTSAVEAVVEATSMIHALVEFKDGSTTAHLSRADMALAIAHALGFGGESVLESVDILALRALEFRRIDLQKYRIFSLKDELLRRPDLGVLVNAANEEAVYKFLRGECGFLDISRYVFEALERFGGLSLATFEDVREADRRVKAWVSGN